MLLLASVFSLTPKHIQVWNHPLTKTFRITNNNELFKTSPNWWPLVTVFLEYFCGAIFRVRRYFKIQFASPLVVEKKVKVSSVKREWNDWYLTVGVLTVVFWKSHLPEIAVCLVLVTIWDLGLSFSSLKQASNILDQSHLQSQPMNTLLSLQHTN